MDNHHSAPQADRSRDCRRDKESSSCPKGTLQTNRPKHRRPDNDPHEHVWLSGRETDKESAQSWKECTKNPGHNNFIPVGEFDMQHLPQHLQRADYLDWVKVHAALTVRLRVNCVSDKRPAEIGPSSDSGDKCIGTGFIGCFEPIDGQCPCNNCPTDPSLQQSWEIWIDTAQHVVFDDTEAKMTFVDLYYDDDRSNRDGRCKTLWGVKVMRTSDHSDRTVFYCITHERSLVAQIKGHVDQWFRLRESLMRENIRPDTTMFTVSHPHGQPKMVTVGERKDEQYVWVGGEWKGLLYSYTCGTCPGSSGARVVSVREWEPGLWLWAVHSKRGDKEGWNDGYWY